MIAAFNHEPITGHVPHFELVFFLTMEAFGKVHPSHRSFGQWNQMSTKERELQLQDVADCFILTAEKYGHSAIFVHPCVHGFDSVKRLLEIIREKSGDEYFLMMHGDCTRPMPGGDRMTEVSAQMYEEPEVLIEESNRYLDECLNFAQKFRGTGLLDGFALCSDYCFNTAPFYSPEMFDIFVVPQLRAVIKGYREMGFYSIKHTDGNIMPILEQILDCKPDAIHSLDPQGGVDLAEVKRIAGKRAALIGNVNCGLLQTGTEEEVRGDVLRALRDGMPGGGYIFSTSNCVYTGLPLERYEMMHGLWREHGVY